MNDYTVAPWISPSERDALAKAYFGCHKTGFRHEIISDHLRRRAKMHDAIHRKWMKLHPKPLPFPFLKLPAEIRNQIYRLALLTSNTTTDIPAAKHTYTTPDDGNTQTNEASMGSVRCDSLRTYTLEYQVSILRANKKIHREAWGIFHLENFWTVVQVNKVGFGKEMKERGFPVATGDDLWNRIRCPVMKVTVKFSSLSDQKQSDNFILATIHLSGLIRALWTAKGASEMEVTIHLLPRLTYKSPSKCELLRPFFKLRNIKRVGVSVSSHSYMDLISHVITPTDDINMTFGEIRESIRCLQRYIQEEQWKQAVLQLKEHSTLMNDCKIVYGHRLLGFEPGLDINTAIARNDAFKEIMTTTSLAIGEVALHLGQYHKAISNANYSLLTCRVTFFPAVIAVHLTIVPSYHQCLGLLIRASAYIGLNRAKDALDDIKKATEVMPHNPRLVPVSNAWQERFGPFPDSTTPPVSS